MQSINNDANQSLLPTLESILFIASEPTPVNRLATALDSSPKKIRQQLRQLEAEYVGRGLRLQWHNDAVQLTSAPESSEAIESFLGLKFTSRLSPAALETLAIVVYLQPVTRPQIDDVRGVNSDGSLRTLLSKGLIEEVGRMNTPGRPILYATTVEFLGHFGLNSLADMPALVSNEEE